ncbi:MAG: HigA family addiction module antitoxin [Alistipes sp.]
MAIIYGYTPTHPGEVLKEEIEYRHLSQKALASQIGMSYKVLNDILNARRPLTTETAMRIEAALDIPADSLLHLQMKYNMQTARKDSRLLSVLERIRQSAAVL